MSFVDCGGIVGRSIYAIEATLVLRLLAEEIGDIGIDLMQRKGF
jgi:hypothetical protein